MGSAKLRRRKGANEPAEETEKKGTKDWIDYNKKKELHPWQEPKIIMPKKKNKPQVFNLDQYRGPVFDALGDDDKKRILNIQSDIELKLIHIKTNVYEIGKLLFRAKGILPHGKFQKWVEETFGRELPYSTAACYKGIYEIFKDNPKTVKLLPLNFLIQAKQETFPDEIRNLINENPEAFKESDFDEFNQIYGDFKGGKIDLGGFIGLAKKEIQIGKEILEGESHVRHSLRGKRTIKQGFRQLKDAISVMRENSRKIRTFFNPPEKIIGGSDYAHPKLAYRNWAYNTINQSLDDDLIKDLDKAIEELKKLKIDIEGRRGKLYRHRLVEENGVMKKTLIPNL